MKNAAFPRHFKKRDVRVARFQTLYDRFQPSERSISAGVQFNADGQDDQHFLPSLPHTDDNCHQMCCLLN